MANHRDIVAGPSAMELMFAMFDRDTVHEVRFTLDQEVVPRHVLVTALEKGKSKDEWVVTVIFLPSSGSPSHLGSVWKGDYNTLTRKGGVDRL